MRDAIPEGDDLRRAVRWVSENLQENPDGPVSKYVQEAIFKYDLSPKDADFLINFYSSAKKSE